MRADVRQFGRAVPELTDTAQTFSLHHLQCTLTDRNLFTHRKQHLFTKADLSAVRREKTVNAKAAARQLQGMLSRSRDLQMRISAVETRNEELVSKMADMAEQHRALLQEQESRAQEERRTLEDELVRVREDLEDARDKCMAAKMEADEAMILLMEKETLH